MQLRYLLPFILFCSGLTLSHAEEIPTWTVITGNTFQGVFIDLSLDRKSAQFRTKEGKTIVVPLERFSEKDRQALRMKAQGGAMKDETPKVEEARPASEVDPSRMMRELFPAKAYGATQGTMIEAMCMGMVWWDQAGHMKLPATGTMAKRAGWLVKRLERYVESDAGIVDIYDAWKGVEIFFQREMQGVATCMLDAHTTDFSAKELSKLTKGNAAVVLRMSMVYSTDKSFSVSTLLESVTPDGKFSMVLDGVRLRGRIVPVESVLAADGEGVLMEFVIDNRDELHERYVKNGTKFYLGWRDWNGAIIMKPVLLNEVVAPTTAPDDKDMPVWVDHGVGSRTFTMNAQHPVAFSSPVVGERQWSLRTGSSARASVVSRDRNRVTLKRTPGGQLVTLDMGQLAEEDTASIYFWEASKGVAIKFPPLKLEYGIDTPNGPYEFTISTADGMGRIDYENGGNHSFIIFDTRDGSFAMDKTWDGEDGKYRNKYSGKFVEDYFMPTRLHGPFTQGEVDQFIEKTIPASKEAAAIVPCRTMNVPLGRYSMDYREAKIDFVLSEDDTVLIALRMVLEGVIAGPKANTVINPIHLIPTTKNGYTLIPMLSNCKVLPLNMSWHNQKHPEEERLGRLHYSGNFSLKVKRAIAPAVFPDDHFLIAPEIRSMSPGEVNYAVDHTRE